MDLAGIARAFGCKSRHVAAQDDLKPVMTTAFAHAVRGEWIRAFNAQPAGWTLCVAVMAVAYLTWGATMATKLDAVLMPW